MRRGVHSLNDLFTTDWIEPDKPGTKAVSEEKHWDWDGGLTAGVNTHISWLQRENAALRASRLSRHGFDCFATRDPYNNLAILGNPWPLDHISQYQVSQGIKLGDDVETEPVKYTFGRKYLEGRK